VSFHSLKTNPLKKKPSGLKNPYERRIKSYGEDKRVSFTTIRDFSKSFRIIPKDLRDIDGSIVLFFVWNNPSKG
jgi:hypothetical protein